MSLPPPRDLRQASRAELDELASELFREVGPRVGALGRRFAGGDPEAGEELLAETFSRVVSALPRFQGRSSYATWVLRIATHVLSEKLRRRRRRPRVALEQDPPGDEPTASARLRSRERAARIRSALADLSPSHRMVLSLVALEGLPRSEVAEILGVPEGTVWSRYARARLALAERFRAFGLDDPS
jgi:RNA polymerase sigma-70 factor (ECF subfamily)